MKKKINRCFIGIVIFSITLTLITITAIFYNKLKTQVFADLEVMADLLNEATQSEDIPQNIRVTLIKPNGVVEYDSLLDATTMSNHLDRIEVQLALENKEGCAIRISDTISESVFYYAKLLEDGRVLRVGKTSISVIWIFVSAIPIIIGMLLILLVICMVVSHYITIKIVKPIEDMANDMECVNDREVYKELVPFIQKIRSQHEEILQATNVRQEFTANVSHELKTPLTAISGYAELMETGVAKEEDVKHFSREIHKSANRLLNLINDTIKLSKLDENDNIEMLEVVDIADIVKSTINMLQINADKNNIRMKFEGCESAKVHIGKEFAEEVAYNLIENAIRYNKTNGEVLVKVQKSENLVKLIVKDTGIGIQEEDKQRIFERFYRVDKSRSKASGGTGLGLAIVKHICEIANASIELESEFGKGTTITIAWQSVDIA